MSRHRDQRDKELLVNIREVAKLGLDDPDRLAELTLLLDLPAVRKFGASASQAKPFLSVRCRALADLLLTLFKELTAVESTQTPQEQRVRRDRKVALDGLFMLTDEWKGIGITNRRQMLGRLMLAPLEPDEDTTTFRRTIEEPTYRLILAHLDTMGRDEHRDLVDEKQSEVVRSVTDLALHAAFSMNLTVKDMHKPEIDNGLYALRDYFRLLLYILDNRLDQRRVNGPQQGEMGAYFLAVRDVASFHLLSMDDLSYCQEKYITAYRRDSDCFSLADFASDEHGKAILRKWSDWMVPAQTKGPEQFIDACISLVTASVSDHQLRLSRNIRSTIEYKLPLVRDQVVDRRADGHVLY